MTPISAIRKRSRPSGVDWSGKSSSAVAIALALISGPDIRSVPLVAVLARSLSVGSEAPITTTLPLKNPGGTWPLRTREKGTDE
jgi:hypothetical protein